MKRSFTKAINSLVLSCITIGGLLLSNSTYAQSSITVVGKDTICSGSSVALTAKTTRVSGVSFSWADSLGGTSTITLPKPDSAIVNPTVSTTYRLIGDSAGVMDTVYKRITVLAVPTVMFSAKDTVCAGDTIFIKGSGATTYEYFRGSNRIGSGDSLQVIVASSDSFSVVGTSGTCSASAFKKIFAKTKPSSLITVEVDGLTSRDRFACAGVNFDAEVASGFASYKWNPASGVVSGGTTNKIVGNITQATLFSVDLVGTNGCKNTVTQLIRTSVMPTGKVTTANFQTGSDSVLCGGETSTVVAQGGDAYSWSPTTGVNDPTAAVVVLNPASNQTYIVKGIKSGCITRDTVRVYVSPLPTLSFVSQTSSAANKLCEGTADTIKINTDSKKIQWGTTVSSRATKTFAFKRTTTFNIKAFNELNCFREITVTSHVDTTCGVRLNVNELNSDDIEAYYVAETAEIKLTPATVNGIGNIQVYDLFGNEILNQNAELNKGTSYTYDMSQLAAGVYVFRVVHKQRNYSLKFVKD